MLPGVLVIQEVGGVNKHIEDVTRRLATAGYSALAPDMFAVDGKRPEALTRERIAEAFAFAGRLPPGALFDPAAREAALREAERFRIRETLGQVFSFAAPGRAESLLASLHKAFSHLRDKRAETRGQRVNEGVPGFQEAMRAAGKPFEHHMYDGAGHAFFNDDGPSYDAKAARDS